MPPSDAERVLHLANWASGGQFPKKYSRENALSRTPLNGFVNEVFQDLEPMIAAQEIKPQARVLAEDRGIRCLVLDYDALRGTEDPRLRLF